MLGYCSQVLTSALPANRTRRAPTRLSPSRSTSRISRTWLPMLAHKAHLHLRRPRRQTRMIAIPTFAYADDREDRCGFRHRLRVSITDPVCFHPTRDLLVGASSFRKLGHARNSSLKSEIPIRVGPCASVSVTKSVSSTSVLWLLCV